SVLGSEPTAIRGSPSETVEPTWTLRSRLVVQSPTDDSRTNPRRVDQHATREQDPVHAPAPANASSCRNRSHRYPAQPPTTLCGPSGGSSDPIRYSLPPKQPPSRPFAFSNAGLAWSPHRVQLLGLVLARSGNRAPSAGLAAPDARRRY